MICNWIKDRNNGDEESIITCTSDVAITMIHGQQESTQRTLNIVFNNDELPRQIPGNWVTPPGRRRRVFPPRRTGSLNQPGKQRIKWFHEYRIRFASFVRLGASPQPTTSLTWPSCPLVGLPVVRRLHLHGVSPCHLDLLKLWLRLIFLKLLALTCFSASSSSSWMAGSRKSDIEVAVEKA